MKCILVLTVGGSCAPIVTSVRQHRPERVYFLCSGDDPVSRRKGSHVTVNGTGDVCGPDPRQPTEPSIVTQTGLGEEQYEIIQVPPDDLNRSYEESFRLLRRLRQEDPECELIADYTGGTKSMSAALVLAALNAPGVRLGLVTGNRADLVRVTPLTESARRVSGRSALLDRQLALVEMLVGNFDYAGAAGITQTLLATEEIPLERRQAVEDQLLLCRAFDAWDKFDHETAHQLLTALSGRVRAHYVAWIKFLDAIRSNRRIVEEDAASGARRRFDLIEDLLLNAERRATQGRHDDAVARLYRATELVAQLWLLYRRSPLKTGDLDISRLPEGIRAEYEARRTLDGKIKLGLVEAYRLIRALEPDRVGVVIRNSEGSMQNALESRNQSLMAHGIRPVSEVAYRKVGTVLLDFINAVLQTGAIVHRLPDPSKQLPRTLEVADGGFQDSRMVTTSP
jgi:CRISPR-associated protein (TIGR02710 family)